VHPQEAARRRSEGGADGAKSSRGPGSLVYIGVLGAAQVAILYVLLAVETPLSPAVHRLVEKPSGVIVLALFGLSVVVVGMWAFTSWAERHQKKQEGSDRPSPDQH
jgi:Co/Zn/Cd efflux system component